jgi:hypothetical protein
MRSTVGVILVAILTLEILQIVHFERYLLHSVPSELQAEDTKEEKDALRARTSYRKPAIEQILPDVEQQQQRVNHFLESINNDVRLKQNTNSPQMGRYSRAESFPWDRDNICFVVENICNLRKSQWFYFSDDSSSKLPKQPKHFSLPGRLGPYISPNWPKETITQLQQKKCMISKVTNHLVVSGRHIRMMAEYYQRIMLPLHHLMNDYISSSNATSINEKEI